MPYLIVQVCLIWVLWGWNLKTILPYLKSSPGICLTAKFGEKTKMRKFGTKNAFFGYFWTKNSKNFCHI